jgi:NAD(P)-dependent dehydrogenase (short-subunit alcohol dehydrogenase family)
MSGDDPQGLTGKIILITGASGGLGLEAAVELARRGAEIVITGRAAHRTDAALGLIQRRSGSGRVQALLADFASQSAVRKLADAFCARHPRLDILINNAGSVNPQHALTEDGIETTFAVNHLAPFLLTGLLLDTLVASAPARIVNVASAAHYRGTLDFDDLGFAHGYGVMRAYARSKLANVLFTRALAKRLAGTGVTANAVHPGTVATGIWHHGAPWWARGIFNGAVVPILRLGMLSPAAGARTIVYAAVSPDLAGKTGLYLDKNGPKQPSPLACDEALADRLWTESAHLTRLDTG